MHVLKVTVLLVLTLALMRSVSWLVGWLSHRLSQAPRWVSTLTGNVVGLALFTAFLFWNLSPGESFDFEPLAFGIVVFSIYQVLDLKWCWWCRSGRSAASASKQQQGEQR